MRLNLKRTVISFIIILNIGFLFSLIPDIFFNIGREGQIVLFLAINLLTIVFFRNDLDLKNNSFKVLNERNPFSYAIMAFFALIFLQILINAYNSISEIFYLSFALFMLFGSFYILVLRLVKVGGIKYNVNFFVNIYVNFSAFMIVTAVFVFFLIHLGVLDYKSFIVSEGRYALLDANSSKSLASAYFPLYSTFIVGNPRPIPFFGEFGLFTALFHEPHLSTLFITPAIFLMNSFEKYTRSKRRLLNLTFVIYVLIATSATNIMVMSMCFIIYFILRNKGNFFLILFSSIVLIFILLLFTEYYSVLEEYGFGFLSSKLNVANSSRTYSEGLLEYMFSPKTFIGTGSLVNAFSEKAKDIGFLSFTVILFIHVCVLNGIIKIFLKDTNRKAIFIGLGILYFYIHSFKIGAMSYQFCLTLFILVIGKLCYNDLFHLGNQKKKTNG